MNVLPLKLFISVSQTRSFTQTAKEFYMTQPTVSNNIKALEESVGVKLLKRDTHRVDLTFEGREYLEYVVKILATQIEAENRLRNISKGRLGYLKIAMMSSSAKLFTECLTEYSWVHPEVQIEVFKLEGIDMMKAINRHDYDIYFANHYMVPVNDGFDYFVTQTEQMHLFVHKDIADKINISDWSTMRKLRFVAVPELDFALSGQIKNIYSNRGLEPDTISYFNQADMQLLAVNSGIGATILPPGITYYYNFPNVVSIPISGEDAVIKTVVAWHEEHPHLKPGVEAFLSINALKKYR